MQQLQTRSQNGPPNAAARLRSEELAAGLNGYLPAATNSGAFS